MASLAPEAVRAALQAMGQPAYRGDQIFTQIHRGVGAFAEMQTLPKPLRQALDDAFTLPVCHPLERLVSQDGTQKFLLALHDGACIEAVRMEYQYGAAFCLSTQVGCRMGCKFCASGEGGLQRNLTAGEMCAQVYTLMAGNAGGDKPQPPHSVVLMGCGEPLDNYENTRQFLRIIAHPKGLNLGARHITLATCGLVPQIRALARERLQINLAVSLHAPNDTLRREIMPIARRYTLEETLAACRFYADTTHRRITFEYALLEGFNDQPAHANELAQVLRGLLCHVNLIPVNEGVGGFSPTRREGAHAFAAILEQRGINTTVRRTIGADVNAACGQLRARPTG